MFLKIIEFFFGTEKEEVKTFNQQEQIAYDYALIALQKGKAVINKGYLHVKYKNQIVKVYLSQYINIGCSIAATPIRIIINSTELANVTIYHKEYSIINEQIKQTINKTKQINKQKTNKLIKTLKKEITSH